MESSDPNKTKDSKPVASSTEKVEATRSFGSYLLSPFYSSPEKPVEPMIVPISLSPLSDSSRKSQSALDSPGKESVFEEVDFKSKKEEVTTEIEQARRLRRIKRAERKARVAASQNPDDYYSEVEEYAKFRSREMESAKLEISRLSSILVNQQEQMEIMKKMIEKDRKFSHKAIAAAESRESDVRNELRIVIQERESLSKALFRKEEEQKGKSESSETKSREEASAIRLSEEHNRSLTLQLRALEQEKQVSLFESARLAQEIIVTENHERLIKSAIESVGY
jgi:hypothetical protein